MPRSAHGPSSERGTEGLQSPQRHDSAAPQRRTECHSPMRSPRGGGPQAAGFNGITVTPESGALVSAGTPQLLSVPVTAVTASQPDGGHSLAAVGARPGAARELRPFARGPGRNPFLPYRYRSRRWPSRALLSPRLAAAATAATTAAQLGARRSRMLSSTLTPPFWAPRAATSLHIPKPAPLAAPPPAQGPGHAPSRHVTPQGAGPGSFCWAGARRKLQARCHLVSAPSRFLLRKP